MIEGGYTKDENMQTGATATGSGTAITCTEPIEGGFSAVIMQVSGTFVGTITFEATVDGNNWVNILVDNLNTGSASLTATGPGIFRATALGLAQVRARISAYTSGSITVAGRVVA
jgi:hypothetical protein